MNTQNEIKCRFQDRAHFCDKGSLWTALSAVVGRLNRLVKSVPSAMHEGIIAIIIINLLFPPAALTSAYLVALQPQTFSGIG